MRRVERARDSAGVHGLGGKDARQTGPKSNRKPGGWAAVGWRVNLMLFNLGIQLLCPFTGESGLN